MGATSDLLEWYRPRRSMYPWRVRPSPYRILVSEVMLQQTQAARVAPSFRRFVRRFPSVRALAAASKAEVLRVWDGLGYNRRAIWLSEAARLIVSRHGGKVPGDPETLRTLPGVGSYTANAVAALAFGRPLPAMDVNVERVVSRVRLGHEASEISAPDVSDAARRWLGLTDPAAWNQAIMDLGREVCRPLPRCPRCPLAGECRSRGRAAQEPRAPRSSARFEGSSRQARGAVVRALRVHPTLSFEGLLSAVGIDQERLRTAVVGLHRDGVINAGPAARAGRSAGRVRLAEG